MSDRTVKPGDLILVTGGTGFIGAYVIELLLNKGYRVRVAVRDIKNEDNYAFLKKFTHKEGQIEFVGSASDGPFDDAVKGVHGVIHIASPYIYTAPDPQRDIVDPAIRGVTSMLEACAKTPSVKRVVVTSSGGAILHFPVAPKYVFGENDWSEFTVQNHPYFCSKRLAEQAGWEFWKQNKDKFDFVVVNPLLVLGPSKEPRLNSSQKMLIDFFMGKTPNVQAGGLGVTDVRDVAEAHIIAIEHPEAAGRRLISYSQSVTWKGLVAEMKKQFPKYPVTPVQDDEKVDFTFDTTPLESMGKKDFIKFEDMLRDMINSWIEHGHVPKL